MQNEFGGVLLVLLGLELIDIFKTYTHEHHLRLKIVFVVAMIAVGRHVIDCLSVSRRTISSPLRNLNLLNRVGIYPNPGLLYGR